MAEEGVILLSKEQLPQLQEKLASLLPRSVKVCSVIKRLELDPSARGIVVNKWPDFTVLVEKQISDKVSDLPRFDPFHSLFTTVGCQESEVEDFLLRPGVIDWKFSQIRFRACSLSLQNVITKVVEKKGRKASLFFRGQTYYMTAGDPIPQFDLPPGFILSSVTPEEAHILNSHWPELLPEAFARAILKKFQSVAIRDQATGSLVGYYLQVCCFGIEKLFVVEEHRRKGLGKVLATEVARKVIQAGHPAVFTSVVIANLHSATLHEKCGFKKLDEEWVLMSAEAVAADS